MPPFWIVWKIKTCRLMMEEQERYWGLMGLMEEHTLTGSWDLRGVWSLERERERFGHSLVIFSLSLSASFPLPLPSLSLSLFLSPSPSISLPPSLTHTDAQLPKSTDTHPFGSLHRSIASVLYEVHMWPKYFAYLLTNTDISVAASYNRNRKLSSVPIQNFASGTVNLRASLKIWHCMIGMQKKLGYSPQT